MSMTSHLETSHGEFHIWKKGFDWLGVFLLSEMKLEGPVHLSETEELE